MEGDGWDNIVERDVNEFDVYSNAFKPGGGDVETPRLFEDDLTMPSNFNISQNQYSAAVESGDPFQREMAHLQQSFDHIMHSNFRLEQEMNKKVLHR